MGQKAFRESDQAVCPAHGLATALPIPREVRVNGKALLAVGDQLACGGGADAITSGAVTVRVRLAFAARVGETSTHGARLMDGSGNVFIGGPSAAGACKRLEGTCFAMAAGRDPPADLRNANGEPVVRNTARQSYSNCGLETMRQIIRQRTGRQLTEDELLNHFLDNYASKGSPRASWSRRIFQEYDDYGERSLCGGTYPPEQVAVLADFGVPSHETDQSPAQMERDIEAGRGIVANVWAGTLWGADDNEDGVRGGQHDIPDGEGAHAVVVTGLIRDEHGTIVAYFINDTAKNCGKKVPAALFERSLRSQPCVVTDDPIY